MLDWIKTNKVYVIGGALTACLLLYFGFSPINDEESMLETDDEWLDEVSEPNLEDTAEVEEVIIVDVKGAVTNPGVYETNPGDRVIDLITKAGGLKETADEEQINFAQRVEDEMVLYVPQIGEEAAVPSGNGVIGSVQDDGKVNLNTATETELQTLTGIGPSKATAIIEYRETNGSFKQIEDLKEISGIGEKTFEKLQESIKVK